MMRRPHSCNGDIVFLVTLLALTTNLGYILTQADDSGDMHLEFLDKTSNFRVMRRCDDCNSDAIDLSSSPVPFGDFYHYVAHVATNGLISFGGVFMHFDPVPFTNNNTPTIYASFVAAPYWADIDNSYTGEIWYEIHTAKQNLTESNSLLRKVSEYIRKEQDEPLFNGSWMLVATWNESFPYLRPLNVSEQEHNTFQGVIVTNGTKTYAVYTYHCDDISWTHGNRTVIGFNAGGTYFANHPLSSTKNASDIDCESLPASEWHNVVYDLNPQGSNSSINPPLGGSCLAAGYTDCCQDSGCAGSTASDCYCDGTCHLFGDCCYDIEQTCPASGIYQNTGNDTFLIVASFLSIYQINLSFGGASGTSVFHTGTLSQYMAVDYDHREQYIYFSDTFLGQIARKTFNGTSTETLFNFNANLERSEDIAVDWISNNLYWTDGLNRRLQVLDLDSKHRSELLRTGAHSAPRAIVTDPSTRYMYWGDWGEPAKIERASMDGNNREVLHDTDLTWPNGLAIDYQLQRLYWADAFTDKIEYSRVDGNGREILLTVITGLHHPFSLTISGDQIYWTDWFNYTVYTAHKQSATSILPLYETFFEPNGIEAVDPNRQWTNITNYCEGNPCSHLCLLSSSSPNNYTCACPEGSSLTQDGVSCSEPTNVTLRPPQQGSCVTAGFTSCCNGGWCAGSPPTCYCEPDCKIYLDCCYDFHSICMTTPSDSNLTTPPETTIPSTSTTSISSLPTTSTMAPTELTIPVYTTPMESTTPTESTTSKPETTFPDTTTQTTAETTESISISSPSKLKGGAIAGVIIVVILSLVLLSAIVLGVLWVVRKKQKQWLPQTYATFDGSETVTTGDFKPNLNVYEQKNKLGNDNVSYEAVGEKIHFKLKPDDFTPI